MPIIRSSHYYWVGGPPKVCLAKFKSRLNQPFSAFGTQYLREASALARSGFRVLGSRSRLKKNGSVLPWLELTASTS